MTLKSITAPTLPTTCHTCQPGAALMNILGHKPTMAALVFSEAPVDSRARLVMLTMSDSERSMPGGLASNDYKKLRKRCSRPTPTRRTDKAGRRDVDNGDADDGWSAQRPRELGILTRDLCQIDDRSDLDGSSLVKQPDGKKVNTRISPVGLRPTHCMKSRPRIDASKREHARLGFVPVQPQLVLLCGAPARQS